jgi:hypothetical protein
MSIHLDRSPAIRHHASRIATPPGRSAGDPWQRAGSGGGCSRMASNAKVRPLHCCLSSGLGRNVGGPAIDDGDPAFAGWSPAELYEFFSDQGDAVVLGDQFVEASVRAAMIEVGGAEPASGLALFKPDGVAVAPTAAGAANAAALRGRAAGVAAALGERPPVIDPGRRSAGSQKLGMALRGKRRFGWLEPVMLELELSNRDPLAPLQLRARPAPAYGALGLLITRPDGTSRRFAPVLRLLSSRAGPALAPAGAASGRDRLVTELFLAYDARGHAFATPGAYRVEATFADAAGEAAAWAVAELEVAPPADALEARLGADLHDDQAGLVLALGGARSPRLAEGLWALEELLATLPDSPAAARIGAILAEGLARPMFRVVGGRLRPVSRADRPRALALARRAIPLLAADPTMAGSRRRLMGLACRWLTEEGQHEAAREMFDALARIEQADGAAGAASAPPH